MSSAARVALVLVAALGAVLCLAAARSGSSASVPTTRPVPVTLPAVR